MSGGILQLVAKGAQDVYLTNNPEITFFKIVYRRHTMFSKCELDVAFSGTPNFGSIIKSKIQKSGDLLHRLFLATKLPEIELIFKSLKIKEVVDILYDYDISWTPNKKLLNNKFDQENYEVVCELIDCKIEELCKTVRDVDKIEKILEDCSDNKVEHALMKEDKNYLIYKQLTKEITRLDEESLTNSNKIMNEMCGKICLDKESPSIQNLTLLRKLNDRDSKTDIKDKYHNLDAYKIYKIAGNRVSDVKQGLVDNITCLRSVCESLNKDISFMFFKDDVSGVIINSSLINKKNNKFNDELSNALKLKGVYGKFVSEEVKKFHRANTKLFKDLNLDEEKDNINCEFEIINNKSEIVINLNQWVEVEMDGTTMIIPEYIRSKYLSGVENGDMKEELESIIKSFKESIWYIIMSGFIKNYNNLYKTLFDVDKCTDNVGIEMGHIVGHINTVFNTSSCYTDRHRTDDIKTYCEDKLNKWKEQLVVDEKSSKWVDVDIPENRYMFEKMSVLDEYLKDTHNINSTFKADKCGVLDTVKYLKNRCQGLKEVLDFIDNEYLYSRLDEINESYNGFTSKGDVCKFIKELIVEKSYLGDSKCCKDRDTAIEKFSQIKLRCELLLTKLKEESDYCGLKSKLLRSVSCDEDNSCSANRANFAWIQYVGHYIIDYVSVKIGDQEIEKHTGEYLQLLHQQTKKDSKERGYNEMIGNVSELTKYDNSKKDERELITPLKFWFSKYLSGSLPLVAMLHTEIEITVKYKELNEVAFFDKFTTFKSVPKLSSKLIGEYIYVGNEERERLVKCRLEYLIDQVEYNGDGIVIDDKSVNNKSNCDDLVVEERLYYENPCKEYIWVMQRLDFIDGSLPGGEILYHNYSFDLEEKINPAKEAKIQFSNRNREEFKFIDYYNYVEPDKHHYSTPSRGINSYSFALFPEQAQPSGAANLSIQDDTSLVVKMKEEVVRSMRKRGIKFRWGIYVHKINFLRIYSGVAGLTFFNGASNGMSGDSEGDSCCEL